jgi:hypothetical protein
MSLGHFFSALKTDSRLFTALILRLSLRAIKSWMSNPDELKHCACNFPALFYVHPESYRPAEGRVAHQCLVRIPGKHRNSDRAWDAIQDMIEATRH